MILKPFLRWVGGKGKNIGQFLRFLPEDFNGYYYVEPFLGSGALMFKKKPCRGFVSDVNRNLINAYHSIASNVDGLIKELKSHDDLDSEAYYYHIREEYNQTTLEEGKIDIIQSSRFIYLNARCFNGLYRENLKGGMNSPYAKDLKGLKQICNEQLYRTISRFLNRNSIRIECCSFDEIFNRIPSVDGKKFYFLDPPYYSFDETTSFTSYTSFTWNDEKFKDLLNFVNMINENGDLFLLCNHSVDFIKILFTSYNQTDHSVSRSVSCKAKERKDVKEIIITNYKIYHNAKLDDFMQTVV